MLNPMKSARCIVATGVALAGSALSAEDLAWKPLAGTDRAPVAVSAPAVAQTAVVAIKGDEQTSTGGNVVTFAPGTILTFR